MNLVLNFISGKFLAKELDFRVRLFNVLAMAGIIIGMVMSVLAVITHAEIWNIAVNFIGAVLSFCLLFYSYKSGKYQRCYTITTVIIFLIFFPILFFTGGGYHSGMPSFFVFAVLFTVFMLEGKKMIGVALIEVLTYIGICLIAYNYPQSVQHFQTEQELLVDVIIGFSTVCIALGITLTIHFQMYNKQQIELENARREALRFSKEKSIFLAQMSHEIRTPINVILGMNEVLIREMGMKRVRDYSLSIQNAGKILLSLIDNVLDMSKIESGKMEIVNENYRTSDLIDDLALIGMDRVGRRGIEFAVEVDENLPSGLRGDFLHIKQVAVNFLSNGAKYTERGSVTLSFSQKSGQNSDEIMLCISVSDTGLGIKEENIPLLFDAFNRGERSTNRYIEGTGLGLAIAKNFTELMHGHISVESHLGQGSIFTVEIPQKVQDHKPLHKAGVPKREMIKPEDSFISPEGRILVVDDSTENLLVIEALLSRTLLQIDTVRSGRACIEAVSQKDYHVILLDYMMPDMDGIETLHQLKEMPNFSTPVVAVTANVVAGIKETLLSEGFSEYLSKPITWRHLEETIMALLPSELVTTNKQGTQNCINHDVVKKLEKDGLAFGIRLEEGLGYLSGDLFQYKNFATIFVNSYEKNRLEVLGAETKKDWLSLKYLVHSIKSKAMAVGAVSLSDTASKLEQQCAKEDEGYIEVSLPMLNYEWQRVVEGLNKMITGIDGINTEPIQEEYTKEENTIVNREELLVLLRHNRQPDALIAIEKMIAMSQDVEIVEKLKEIWQKVDEIEFREAERLLIAMGGITNGK